jgi:hypothetical protein
MGERRKRAKDRGVRFGRPPKLTHQRAEGCSDLRTARHKRTVARSYAVDPTTIGRLEAAAARTG